MRQQAGKITKFAGARCPRCGGQLLLDRFGEITCAQCGYGGRAPRSLLPKVFVGVIAIGVAGLFVKLRGHRPIPMT